MQVIFKTSSWHKHRSEQIANCIPYKKEGLMICGAVTSYCLEDQFIYETFFHGISLAYHTSYFKFFILAFVT